MKDFKYYSDSGIEYPNKRDYEKSLIEVINNTPLTVSDRNAAMDDIKRKSAEWFKEAVRPYNNKVSELIDEFWRDCRESLGYTDFLDDEGVSILENMAWDRGHANGFDEVFCQLDILCDFAKQIVEHGCKDE